MRTVVTLAFKDLRLLLRNYVALFWILAFPLLLALFFGSIFGGPRGSAAAMSVAVVDEDGSEGSRAFVTRLGRSAALRLAPLPLDEAQEEVRKGRLVAYVIIPPGFGEQHAFFGPAAPTLQVGLDPARQAEAGYLQGLLLEAVYSGIQEQFANPRQSRAQVRKAVGELDKAKELQPEQQKIVKQFLGELDAFLAAVDPKAVQAAPQLQGAKIEQVAVTRTQSRPRTAFEITFPSSVLWGILGCVQAFVISLVSERVGGTFLRLRIAPLTWSQLLAGKALACFLACAGVAVLLLAIGWSILGVRLENPLGLALAIGCTAVCFVGILMLLCTLGKTVEGVSGAAWGILMPLAMLGGGMIPLMVMPGWMLTASHFSPVKWGILALEGAIWRDFAWTEMLLPCGILVGVGVVCFAAGVRVLSREG